MQKAVSVSVIIPTYNGFSRLRPVLSGLERQTAKVKNLEIIIVDDNSKIIDTVSYTHLTLPTNREV